MFTRHQALITVLVTMLGLSAAACATAPPAPSSVMKLGALTAAPEAFVDFCRRQPVDCGLDSKEAPATLAAVEQQQVDATRLTWQVAFHQAEQPTSAPALATGGSRNWAQLFAAAHSKSDAGELRMASSVWDTPTAATGAPTGVDWTKVFGAPRADATPVADDTSGASQSLAIDIADAQPMDSALWTKLNKVNAKVNRAIIRRTDEQAYGVAELWSMPLESGQKYGDCEDYVLEKRFALLASGVPQSDLSIAVVETSWGEGHAVLVVTTNKGEYVLDNLTPWILPWDQTSYRWKARQTTRGTFSWAVVASL